MLIRTDKNKKIYRLYQLLKKGVEINNLINLNIILRELRKTNFRIYLYRLNVIINIAITFIL